MIAVGSDTPQHMAEARGGNKSANRPLETVRTRNAQSGEGRDPLVLVELSGSGR
jgi:hypothetical protein